MKESQAAKTKSFHPKKVNAGKKIQTLPRKGEYEFLLFFENRGDYILENIEIKDVIDSTFIATDFNIKPTEQNNVNGLEQLIWKFTNVNPMDRIQISYKVLGEHDYQASDAQFLYN